MERARRPSRVNGGHPEQPSPTQQSSSGKPLTLASAVGRHPFLVILPAVILLAVGVVLGSKKAPTYSATATINVGKADIATQATPGYVQASEALAASYSRLVTSQHVAVPAAQAVGESPSSVASRISAVPIPNEPTFTITATDSTPQSAVRLARATVSSIVKYAQQSQTNQGGPTQLLNRYHQIQTQADTLQAKADRLQGQLQVSTPGVTQAEVTNAKVAAQTLTLRAQALSNQYLNLAQNGAAPSLDVLIDPTSPTSSDRTSNREKYGVVGAVAGLVIGLALAGMVGSMGTVRMRRRRARAAI
jgi:capsular polysaccharide biosynthesis protein